MTSYVRPYFERHRYQDSNGASIEYGSRWRGGPPPAESYSVTSHPQRFEPIQTIARALITYLESTYDVTLHSDLEHTADFVNSHSVIEAVKLTVSNPACASLTVGFTSFPGVFVHAGAIHDFAFPHCGCDACDDNINDVIDELELTVFSVINGRYRESITEHEQEVSASFRLSDASGSRSGTIELTDLPRDRVAVARERLAAVPNGWEAWPLR